MKHRKYTKKYLKHYSKEKISFVVIVLVHVFLLIAIIVYSVFSVPVNIYYDSIETHSVLSKEEFYKPEIESHVMYWKVMPIHYYFSEEDPCVGQRKSRVIKSFGIIEKETNGLVSFYEEQDDNGIEITCYEEYETEEASGYGGIKYYIGEQEILKGMVKLYKPDRDYFEYCPSTYSSVALHEILHAMGFNHIDSRKSIMTSITACTRLDPEIIDCLKHIYGKDNNYTCQDIPFMR